MGRIQGFAQVVPRPANGGRAERGEALVGDMVRAGILVESNIDGAKSFRFSEDGMAAYLWLQSAADKLRADYRLGAASNAAVALAQGKTQN